MTSMRRWLEDVDWSWHEQGACYNAEPEMAALFDPIADKEPEAWFLGRAETAIEDFCMNCPVMQKCAEERDRHSYQGVWGGEASQKRGIVDTQTGLLIRKHVHDMPLDEADEAAEPLVIDVESEPEFWWEPDVVLTTRGVEQFGLPLAMAT